METRIQHIDVPEDEFQHSLTEWLKVTEYKEIIDIKFRVVKCEDGSVYCHALIIWK